MNPKPRCILGKLALTHYCPAYWRCGGLGDEAIVGKAEGRKETERGCWNCALDPLVVEWAGQVFHYGASDGRPAGWSAWSGILEDRYFVVHDGEIIWAFTTRQGDYCRGKWYGTNGGSPSWHQERLYVRIMYLLQ